ncbi:MAG: hypothetical protein CL774_04825 [Chloroflexi bacterium]|nr:hypothetical protein [Chloroflexota bacterium]|tara:strand:+ start:746 stop:1609 length:864 start_codon:yes stop_codon:yes gene_type:complete
MVKEENMNNYKFTNNISEENKLLYKDKISKSIEYLKNNLYEYGPGLKNSTLSYVVTKIESQSSNILRIYFEFKEEKNIKSKSGLEYIDIDNNDVIQVRRIINKPKENFPWPIFTLAIISLLIAAIFVSYRVYWMDTDGDNLYLAGRSLWVRSDEPVKQEFITYIGNDVNGNEQYWAISPAKQENNLLFVKLSLINYGSGTVKIVIDEDASTLYDDKSIQYKPINPIERTYSSEKSDNYLVNGFIPLWGPVQLDPQEQVTGMMIFEIPKSSVAEQLKWDAGDLIMFAY